MVTLLGGLIGGLLATIVMTAFMMTLGDDSPPPTAALWAKYVGDGPAEEYVKPGMVLHMMYGIGAGVGFVVLVLLAGVELNSVLLAVGAGAVYGVLLSVVGLVLWMKVVLKMDAEPKTMGTFTFFYLFYGVVLGAVVGSGFLG